MPLLLGSIPGDALSPGGGPWLELLVGLGGFALGLLAVGTLAIIEWGAWSLVAPGRRHDPNRPGVEPWPWEPIAVAAPDGARLAGAFRAAPDAHGRTLLVLHGFAEDRAALFDRAQALADRGWNVALLDARGRGDSGGAFCSFGGREADDLRAWIDLLAVRVGPTAWFAAWGRSMGAAIALRAAADDPRLRALVLEAGYNDLTPTVAAWLRRLRVPGGFARPMLWRAGRLAGVSLHRPRPIDLAPQLAVPVSLLHGARDPIAPLADARRLHDALAHGPDRVLDVVADAAHGDVVTVAGPPVFDRVARFLEQARTRAMDPAIPAHPAAGSAPGPRP